jgi:predicted esterase YcpF (UPF0227 family)
MSLTVIYIHGFNSSPQSVKAQQLAVYFESNKLEEKKDYQLHIPALNYQPKLAIKQLTDIIETQLSKDENSDILLIGSSLGGYYSLWLAQKYAQCIAVLVNPAVYPYLLLEQLLGENQNIYTETKYMLTHEHMDELQAIEVTELRDASRILLLTQTGDETLDYREAVDKLQGVEQHIEQGGNHSYQNFVALIPKIFTFAQSKIIV